MNMRNAIRKYAARVTLVVSFAGLLCHPFPGLATPVLGTAQSFAVLGYAGVTNAHSDPNAQTQIFGNVGASPAFLPSITGFPPGIVTGGAIYGAPSIADQALADINTAAVALAGLARTSTLTGENLGGGRTLAPGVYFLSDVTAILNGSLTLDAQNLPSALFVFQLANALTTGSGSVVNVINGRPDTEIYWVLGSSAALGPGSTFAGNILAYSSISLDPTAMILCGRAFARTESVTLIDNFISNNNTLEDFDSGRPDFGSYGFSGGSGDTEGIPEPGTLALLSVGLGAGLLLLRKFRSIR
jgi:type VI secretion system secreted protein VgrG